MINRGLTQEQLLGIKSKNTNEAKESYKQLQIKLSKIIVDRWDENFTEFLQTHYNSFNTRLENEVTPVSKKRLFQCEKLITRVTLDRDLKHLLESKINKLYPNLKFRFKYYDPVGSNSIYVTTTIIKNGKPSLWYKFSKGLLGDDNFDD